MKKIKILIIFISVFLFLLPNVSADEWMTCNYGIQENQYECTEENGCVTFSIDVLTDIYQSNEHRFKIGECEIATNLSVLCPSADGTFNFVSIGGKEMYLSLDESAIDYNEGKVVKCPALYVYKTAYEGKVLYKLFTNEFMVTMDGIIKNSMDSHKLILLDDNSKQNIGVEENVDSVSYELRGISKHIFNGDSSEEVVIILVVDENGKMTITLNGYGKPHVLSPENLIDDGYGHKYIYHIESDGKSWLPDDIVMLQADFDAIKNVCTYPKNEQCKIDIKRDETVYYGYRLTYDSGDDESIVGSLIEDLDIDKAKQDGTFNVFPYNPIISNKIGKCVDYLGLAGDENPGEIADFLDTMYTIVKIGAILLTIVMSMLDFAGTVSKSKDELMATVKKWTTRLIIVVIVLLAPTFIEMIGDIILGTENCLCGIK